MISIKELTQFFEDEFPQAEFTIEHIGQKSSILRKSIQKQHLRPGGTVSGPTLMAMADAAMYAAIIAEVGIHSRIATVNLSINFLRKPSADCDVIAKCQLIRMGRTLTVGEVSLYSDGIDEPVAHVVSTFSMPPNNKNR